MNDPTTDPKRTAGRIGDALMSMTRIIPRRTGWVDLLVFGLLILLLYGLYTVETQWRAPANSAFEIDLSIGALPRYTFFSLCRGLAAFGLSFVFTLVYGYVAARVRGADRVMLPVLDILQSIPVLGFIFGRLHTRRDRFRA